METFMISPLYGVNACLSEQYNIESQRKAIADQLTPSLGEIAIQKIENLTPTIAKGNANFWNFDKAEYIVTLSDETKVRARILNINTGKGSPFPFEIEFSRL
jgi:hypothetical protein